MNMPNDPYIIRPVKMEDYKQLKNVYFDTFDLIDDADFHKAWKNRNQQSSMGLYYMSTLVGFGIVAEQRLWFLGVHPQFRSAGQGTRLLQAILSTMEYCYLTPVNDDKIIAWYERQGFRITKYLKSNDAKVPSQMMVFHRYETRSRSNSIESISYN